MRISESDPHTAELAMHLEEHAQPWVGDIEVGLDHERPQDRQTGVSEHGPGSPPVAPEDHRVKPVDRRDEKGRRGVDRCAQRHLDLSFPTPGEPLLRPATGGAAAVHLA